MVTGGVGSIGSEICRQVLGFGAKKLIIFDINENGLFDIDNELKKIYDTNRYELTLGSIRDERRLDELFKVYQPNIVFHAAAHKHVPMMEANPKEAIKNNVFGTINVAKSAIAHHAEKFILISTDKAVNPTNIMGASKRIAELCIQKLDNWGETELAAVRFGNVLGSNGSVVPFFKEQIKSGGPVTVTHPDMRRYFMTIPEAVQLVLEAGSMACGGEIFVLDMGEPVKIYDLACDLIRLSGYEPEKDIKVVFSGLRPGEKLFEEISLKGEDTTRTGNNKIYICKPMENDSEIFINKLNCLEQTLEDEDMIPMFMAVKAIVETFNHKNIQMV
jgi:FlaA1/EpsC-like NDP-sugar epimerase